MEPVQAAWTGGSQPASHLCFSLSAAALLHFCSLPFPLFASCFCSGSGQRLIRPNPWQCLAHGTGSLAAALEHCGDCVCSRFREEMECSLRHCLSTFPLPDGTQQKECASWQPSSLSSSFLHPFIPFSISPVVLSTLWICFQVQNVQHEVRQRKPRRQIGTWEGALESQVVLSQSLEEVDAGIYSIQMAL